jgi:hypothetical protein
MRKPLFWMYAAAFTLLGCTERPAPPFAIEFAPGTAETASAMVIAAAESWNAQVGFPLFHAAEPEQADTCERIVVHVVEEMPVGHDEAIGLFEQVGCHYEISLRRSTVRDPINAAHELGHSLDIGHSEDSQSVMFWATGPRATITPADVDRVRARWAL